MKSGPTNTGIRSRTRVIATVAAVGLLAVGCQSGTAGEESGGEVQQVLTIAQASDLQPGAVVSEREGNGAWAMAVFETLTTYDADGVPQPRLATDWTVSDDGLSMDLALQGNVTFHTGRAMTADDVKFTLEYMPESGSQVAYIAESIEGIEVTSDTELTLTFNQPTPNIFDLFEYAFIIDQETMDGLEDGTEVIGTGPFTFDEWIPGTSATLTRYDDYWQDMPEVEEIDLIILDDSTAMLNALQSGRAQIGRGMNTHDIASLTAGPEFEVHLGSLSAYPLAFDVHTPPFDDVEVRQAINYAVDRERIVDQVFGGNAIATSMYWDSSTAGFPEELQGTYAYDPDRARKMIQNAGAAGTEFTIVINAHEDVSAAAEIVRNNLEEIGLVPSLELLDSESFNARQTEGDMGAPVFMPLHGLGGLSPATIINVKPAIRENNLSQFGADEWMELRHNLESAKSDQESADALRALSEYMLEESFANTVSLAYSQTVVDTSVTGLQWSQRTYIDPQSAAIGQ